ncbi:hypothetical protein DLAC_09486 [Tieghemostelium lacteum]|uniref:Uncharacterized protein n=1 Tax=Tieghemostelium lacteum TaxID=361077 RepID=A0A151Z6H6_TIELA|nr:hypothetical protein DLAC_09486 [Tieghemostelium lacteum]|eukprot:KYQ89538.1 hypothetical protein DLAC_09486 [Tieghemostelium lacteum]
MQIPFYILKYILICFRDIINQQSCIYFNRFFIINLSLVSKQFKKVVESLVYPSIDIHKPKHLDIIIRWLELGFNIQFVSFPSNLIQFNPKRLYKILKLIGSKPLDNNGDSISKTMITVPDNVEIFIEDIKKYLPDMENIFGNRKRIDFKVLIDNELLELYQRYRPMEYFTNVFYHCYRSTSKTSDFNTLMNKYQIKSLTYGRINSIIGFDLSIISIGTLVSLNLSMMNIDSSEVESILGNNPSIEKLRIANKIHFTGTNPQIISNSMSNLKNLRTLFIFLRSHQEPYTNLVKLLNNCQLLEELEFIISFSGFDPDLEVIEPKRVQKLILAKATGKRIPIETLWKSLSNIREMRINVLKLDPVKSILEHHRNLTKVQIHFQSKKLNLLAQLISGSLSITHYELRFTGRDTFDPLPLLESIKKSSIETLILNNFLDSFENEVIILNHATLHNLTISSLNSEITESICNNPHLKSVFINGDSSIQCFLDILHRNISLTSLGLRSIPNEDNFDQDWFKSKIREFWYKTNSNLFFELSYYSSKIKWNQSDAWKTFF